MTTTSTPRAKWFVIAFHWEMAALLALLGVACVAAPFFALQRLPWPWARWSAIGMAVVGPPTVAYVSYLIVRRVRWLQGRGPYAEPILAPPRRANTLSILFAGCFFALMGIFEAGPFVWKTGVTIAGLFGLVFGYPAVRWAWARETAINEEQQ